MGLIIAIDGPAGSGKSSLGELIARRYNLRYLDTGLMYRAVTALALRRSIALDNEAAVADIAQNTEIVVGALGDNDRGQSIYADGRDMTQELRTPELGRNASAVAAMPEVRRVLVCRQREFASNGQAVLVGRDVGTVVVPDAPTKIYLEAGLEVRAARRQAQLRAHGIMAGYEEVLAEIQLRDRLDTERAVSPLSRPADAMVINTEQMALEEEAALVAAMIRNLIARRGYSEEDVPDSCLALEADTHVPVRG